ncbi:MAG: DEAD/DEAH box helicase family protein [Subdoligranulum sp.]|jgi:DNA or RNA helicases of superfamily II|nr:DEAD/DEAH box helicase family protein [Subdoligranulum sp.]
MELKKFQKQVISDLNRYCELLNSTNSVVKAYNDFWLEKGVRVGFEAVPTYNNTIANTPHVCFKVPTGGGKTFLACNSLKTIFGNLPSKKAKVVVWLVPSDAILTQTLKNLSNPEHSYRQKIETDFNGRVQVYSKQQVLDGQQFNPTTVNEQLSIVVMSFDSFRIKNKEGRKVYQENGNLQQFAKFITTPETLIEGIDDTSLIQVLNQLSPVVVVDESHHTTGDLSVEMLKNLNPCFILDLTATPRKNSNIISYVDAAQLKAENMVKLPVIVYNRPSQEEVIADAIDLRNRLDELAETNTDECYIRPIVLFQAQPRNAENKETFDKLKERLVENGIPAEEIAIKTAEINEIKDKDLMSSDCKIKYIITVNALKEGWDCSFAYILATLANKTSTVDVEQILGRVLRLPYTKQNASKFLNLSYVLTSSNDFHATISKVIQGLNDAGFSDKDYRIAEEKSVVEPVPKPVQQEITLKSPTADVEEFLEFDSSALKAIIDERKQSDKPITAIDDMLASAEAKSDTYEEELKNLQSEPLSDLPLEIRSKVTTYRMYDKFKDEALALEIPQFYFQSENSLFAFLEGGYQELVSKEFLSDGFTLKDKGVDIDFRTATESVAEIDVNKNETPKYRFMQEAESEYFKEMFKNQTPESRIKNCKYQIKQILEKSDFVAGSELTAYIDRVVENMNGDELTALEKNVHGFATKIKDKINKLLDVHRRERFKHLLETGKIECLPSFKLKSEINPGETFSLLSKSLYVAEQTMNPFERRVVEKVSSMPNIKWWHRNIERHEFCINGFINHYPDFIVMTNSGFIVMIEAKGEHLTSNDDSREKAELGKIWQAQAGGKFRYYMVSEDEIASNPDAIGLDKFLSIVKEL